MWSTRLALLITISGFVGGGVALAQDRPAKNPREGDPEAISAGREIFRSRCSDCHGLDGRGYRGPDLTRLSASGASDDRLFQTIRRGVPGSEMPGFALGPDSEVWAVLAYLQTLATVAPEPNPSGNAEDGEKIFRLHCARCHTVNGRGGNLGPDVSRIGAIRSRPLLSRKIRRASSNIVPGYEPVTLVTRDGQRIRAVKKSEDSYSIQIMDMGERLQGYRKADLRELVYETTSVMPDFGPDRLNGRDLDHLLRYLGTLREHELSVR
jgi:putative heme-binding domain-containing protein